MPTIPDFEFKLERLGDTINVCITKEHNFGTDAFLLASFAAPRRKDLCCDLGTGCGIIPLYWARHFQPRKCYAIEIMPRAIAQLEYSLGISRLETEIIPLEQDLKKLDRNALPIGRFDLVSCNPPYKTGGTGILSESASGRAARHETLCALGDVCRAAAGLLRFGGRFCLCQRPERLFGIAEEMRKHSLEPKRLRFVQQRAAAAPWLFLLEGRKGGKPFLTVEKPLIIEENSGFSRELLEIYSGKTETGV
ncbi:MAG: methyltransferase [Oscillospiraceae bacterium]|nr:methyltransferase [Oscillospiraceae bacterium]